MKIIIAGSRDATPDQVRRAISACPWVDRVSVVVSGTASGADQQGEKWAEERGLPIQRFPADWKAFGKAAGPVRNREMADNADGLIAVWDGASRGTKSMIDLGLARGLRLFLFRTDDHSTHETPPTGAAADRWASGADAPARTLADGRRAPRPSELDVDAFAPTRGTTEVSRCLPLMELRTPNVMWLLGAGASAAANIPTAGHLVWDLKRKLFCAGQRVRVELCQDLGDPVLRRRIQSHLDGLGRLPADGDPEEYSKYFEEVYPTEADRRKYIESLAGGGVPSAGHAILAVLLAMDRIRVVWTTNFDALVEDAAAGVLTGSRRLTVAAIDNAHVAADAVNEGRYPLLVKLHGDYRSRRLKNTTDELRRQDESLRHALTDACRRFGLAVVGYSGRDESVMSALRAGFADGRGFPAGLFWFHRRGAPPLPAVEALLAEAVDLGIDAHLIEIDTFDEVMHDQLLLAPPVPEDLSRGLQNSAPRVSPAPIPQVDGGSPVLRMNALPIVSAPTTCRLVECGIGGARAVKDAVSGSGRQLSAGRRQAGVIAYGSNGNIRSVFEPFGITRFDVHVIEPERLGFETAEHGLLQDALAVALSRDRPLILERKGSARILRVNPDEGNHPGLQRLRSLARPLFGRVEQTNVPWAEAVSLRLLRRLSRLWVILTPIVWLDVRREDEARTLAAGFAREKLAGRFNRQRSEILDAWLELFFGAEAERTFAAYDVGDDGVDAEFRVLRRTAYSRRAR